MQSTQRRLRAAGPVGVLVIAAILVLVPALTNAAARTFGIALVCVALGGAGFAVSRHYRGQPQHHV